MTEVWLVLSVWVSGYEEKEVVGVYATEAAANAAAKADSEMVVEKWTVNR